MGLFGDQGRLARMWGSISPKAMGQGAPPSTATTPRGGSSDKSWFAPRRFSDKIALQKKRQEDLEKTLLEVEAQPVCVIDASLANHPAAQRQLQYEQQQRHLQEAYSQQQSYRLPNIAPHPAPTVPYNHMRPVLVPDERSHAAAGQWGGHVPLNSGHPHPQAPYMQYGGHHQHQQFQHQQHSHVDHAYNSFSVPSSQEHITSPLAEPVFDHDSDYCSRSDISMGPHLSMSCSSSNNSSGIGGSHSSTPFTIDSLLSADGPRQAFASSVDGFNAAYQGSQVPSASGTATPYGKPSFRDRAGSARVQRPTFSRSDSSDMAIASRRSTSLKVHSHRYRSLPNIQAQPETICYSPMASAPALPVPMCPT